MLCPWRRVFLLRKASGPGVGVRGTIGFAWAKEMAAEVLAARLSRSSRGRCGCCHRPPVSQPHASARRPTQRARPSPQPRLNGSVVVSVPDPHPGYSAARTRMSSSAAWRLSMRRSEGEAKCGHKACAVQGHARLRGSLGMLGEDRSPAHA